MGTQTGPCRIVRHPSYAGAVLSCCGFPFMLDTLQMLLPGVWCGGSTVLRSDFAVTQLLSS